MKSKTVVVALLIAIVLVSCQTATTPHANLTETPISTLALLTETAVPTQAATSSQIPSPTESPLDVNVFIRQSSISPSGKWQALVMMTRADNGISHKDSFMLVVVNQQNFAESVVEKIDVQRLMGYSIPWTLAWSENEDFLYYTHRFGGGDGCFSDDNFYGTDLFRFDLENEEAVQLAPKLGYWLALSPNQTLIAYLTNTNTLEIRNIETGEEVETPIEENKKYSEPTLTYLSNLIWSPNGKELLLTLEINVCAMEEDGKNSIIKIDAETLSQKVLVVEDYKRPKTLEWNNDGMVLVQDENRVYWRLNPFTGQMTEK